MLTCNAYLSCYSKKMQLRNKKNQTLEVSAHNGQQKYSIKNHATKEMWIFTVLYLTITSVTFKILHSSYTYLELNFMQKTCKNIFFSFKI